MSIADEARAEAERRYPFDAPDPYRSDSDTLTRSVFVQGQRTGWIDHAEWQASRRPEARTYAELMLSPLSPLAQPEPAPSGPAYIAQMPASPETSRRLWSMYCRECGIEEYMADSADDAGLVAHRDEHNAKMHAEAAPSDTDRRLRQFGGGGVWRDETGGVWVRQSELVEAVEACRAAAQRIVDMYRRLVMDTPEDQRLHEEVTALADRALAAIVSEPSPSEQPEGEKP